MHWYRKPVGKYKYLYIYLARNTPLKPRSLYSHLDHAPDHAVETWITQYKAQYGGPVTPDHILFSDDALSKHLVTYAAYMAGAERSRSPLTIDNQIRHLRRYAIPYFLRQDPPLKDPAKWPAVSQHLARYLYIDRGCRPRLVADINNALQQFWKWLRYEHLAPRGIELELQSIAGAFNEPTPLKFTITPKDVLAFAAGQPRDVQLMALCGYFMSLRPQETFALRPGDFADGDDNKSLDAVTAMTTAGLPTPLVVYVTRQINAKGHETPPKAHSTGYVCCFDNEAAGWIGALVNEYDALDTRMLAGGTRKLYRQWQASTTGTPLAGITLKDLRRASIYWLGHHSGLGKYPVALKNHARHKELETTELYLRRPEQTRPQRTGKLKIGA